MQHILSKMRKAIEDYNMIDEGDKIAVCLSGGKDSITMLNGLKALQRFYPKHFDLIAITVNPGFENFNKDILQKNCDEIDVPVGAVIVKDGKIIARGYNQKETKTDTTKHAEIIAIQKASQKLKAWRLLDCEMYVTLEPCSMCAGAIINSRIKKVYYGTSDNKTGAVGSVLNLFEDFTFNHKVEYEKNIMQTECENILKQFFKELRKNKNV